jgi:hypothetical protein
MIQYAPFGHLFVVDGHENGIFGGVADGVEFSQKELDELLSAVLGDYWEAIDDDKCVQTLLDLNFILRLEI